MGGRGARIGKKIIDVEPLGKGNGILLIAPTGEPLTEDFLKGMAETLDKEGTELAKRAYTALLPELKYGGSDPTDPRVAYYSRYTKEAVFNQGAAANPEQYNMVHKAPFATAFHEFAHAIDHLIGGYGNEHYSSYNSFTNLKQILKDDFKAFKKKKGFKSNDKAFEYFKSKYDLKTRSSLSDALEGVTRRSYPLDTGHGVSYHRNHSGASETEFFAGVMQNSASSKAGYNLLKEVFPNGVKIVEDIVEAELKKRGK